MQRLSQISFVFIFLLIGCGGEEYYSTPQKTLQQYVDNRSMSTREQYEATLNAFRKQDRKWWDEHYLRMCTIFLGKDCPGAGIATEVAVFSDRFEPFGPKTTEVESANIAESEETATLVVQGKEIPFIKERGNWKIKGFFGIPEKLAEQYPELAK